MRGKRWLCLAMCLMLWALGGCAVVERASTPRQIAPEDILSEDILSAEVLDEEPDFSGAEDAAPGIYYGERDALGRATAAFAVLDRSSLSQAPRPDMSALSPTGMHNAWYDFIEDGYVYNRCHLIGHRFSGASELDNLITGTHALNYSYMLPWEDRVAEWLRREKGRVLFRVTPLYEGDALVASSVLLEARSIGGKSALCFSVRCPNAQPGVAIDYATGYTTLADDWEQGGTQAAARRYIINRRTGRFHLEGCEDAVEISSGNRDVRTCLRGELLARGFTPCGKCRP